VSLLIELMDFITKTMIVGGELSQQATYAQNVDIRPLIQGLDDDDRLLRCGDDAFCLGEAIMLYAVEPLLTPEGKGLADVAVAQLETHGVKVERTERRLDHVLALTGTTRDGALEGRIVAQRGWVFLVIGPELDVRALVEVLDARIAAIESRSAG
jgi:hypothetical protein